MNDDTSGAASTTEPKTDWRRLRSMTDAEIHAAIINDPDAAPTDAAFWEDARLVTPRPTETVTLQLDADLLEWFRRERGYQTRINALLRAYMNAHSGNRSSRAIKASHATSPAYKLFEQAMAGRKQILCTYHGRPRELCPIILGHSQGQEKALTYQFGGQSEKGLPPGGQWRCLWLSEVTDIRLRDGPWYAGDRHTQPQGCVETVDLDINQASPYKPKRRLRQKGAELERP
jgi:uncharacterized protein (DUF4415 family)